MTLEQEFSDENVTEYARACFTIAESLINKNKDERFNTLLIPSRGAVPFFVGSMYALQCLGTEYAEFREFFERLSVPKLVGKYVFPADALPREKDIDKRVNILFCPFTADLNMSPYAKSAGLEEEIDVESFVNHTRKYWTKVVNALAHGNKERNRDPYLQFYLYLLREVEGRPELAEEFEDSRRVEGIAMIDTVISGRASTTILDGFKEQGITPYSLLIIDKNGAALKRPYQTKILTNEAAGHITQIPIPQIFTEDRGASLEGVVGVVYPSLMYHANGIDLKTGKFSPVGAGSWYHLPPGDPHEMAFRAFCGMLKSAIGSLCSEYCFSFKGDEETEKMRDHRKSLIGILRNDKLLATDNSSADYIKLKHPRSMTYETGSHVVHICFPEDRSRLIVNEFSRSFNNGDFRESPRLSLG